MRRWPLLAVVLAGCGVPPGANREGGVLDAGSDAEHASVLVGRWIESGGARTREFRADGTGVTVGQRVGCDPPATETTNYTWFTEGVLLRHELAGQCAVEQSSNTSCQPTPASCNTARTLDAFTWSLDADSGAETLRLVPSNNGTASIYTRLP